MPQLANTNFQNQKSFLKWKLSTEVLQVKSRKIKHTSFITILTKQLHSSNDSNYTVNTIVTEADLLGQSSRHLLASHVSSPHAVFLIDWWLFGMHCVFHQMTVHQLSQLQAAQNLHQVHFRHLNVIYHQRSSLAVVDILGCHNEHPTNVQSHDDDDDIGSKQS